MLETREKAEIRTSAVVLTSRFGSLTLAASQLQRRSAHLAFSTCPRRIYRSSFRRCARRAGRFRPPTAALSARHVASQGDWI